MKSNISETILKVVQKVTSAQEVKYQFARAVESGGLLVLKLLCFNYFEINSLRTPLGSLVLALGELSVYIALKAFPYSSFPFLFSL